MNSEHLPNMSERDILEGIGSEALVDYILEMGNKVTKIENKMNEASDILEGSYGLTVEEVLRRRGSGAGE